MSAFVWLITMCPAAICAVTIRPVAVPVTIRPVSIRAATLLPTTVRWPGASARWGRTSQYRRPLVRGRREWRPGP